MADVLPPPIHRICEALQDVRSDVLSHVTRLRAQTDKHLLRPLTKAADNFMAPLNTQLHGALAKIVPPAMASIGQRSAHRGPSVGELAMSKADIVKKLSSVPLYTVTNSQHELVVVSSESKDDTSKMVIFFFNRQDAKSLIDRIRSENRKLAQDARVRTMTADLVYDYLKQRPSETADVGFRLMPDHRQVKAALKLYAEAGQNVRSLRGVPVFQAEDLSVNVDSEDDLDAALNDAHTTRKSAQIAEYTAEASKYRAEFKAATKEISVASNEKDREGAKSRAEAALGNEARAMEIVDKIKQIDLPQVEVACFEDVLMSMDRDVSGKWSQLLFIPPGAMSASKQ